jgi:hypothetical protein
MTNTTLLPLDRLHPQSSENQEVTTDALPPADHGKDAFIALGCCTVAQAPVWGTLMRDFRLMLAFISYCSLMFRILGCLWDLPRILHHPR